jgi:Flp pilus assembly pilin Flp
MYRLNGRRSGLTTVELALILALIVIAVVGVLVPVYHWYYLAGK